jgi:hypothetical protein
MQPTAAEQATFNLLQADAARGKQVRVRVRDVDVFPDEPPESRTSWVGTMIDPPNVALAFAQAAVSNIERSRPML